MEVGDRFGSLVLLSKTEVDGSMPCYRKAWVCQCDCGNKLTVKQKYLKDGQRFRCDDCALKFRAKNISKHGCSNLHLGSRMPTKVYYTWSAMKSRCLNKKHHNYHLYGGRGIKVCDRWLTFENFYKDMGEPPSEKHSIDRIDFNGDYTPENCRWSDVVEQNNNTRSNVFIEYKGERLTLKQWCEKLDIAYNAASWRHKKFNGDPEKTLNPIRGRYKTSKND